MSVLRTLAMTPGEMGRCSRLPSSVGWMACHFSDSGLQDLPAALPPDSLLILDDRVPFAGQAPEKILQLLAEALRDLCCQGLLLDFERRDCPAAAELVKLLTASLPCPVGVSEPYAHAGSGPVFLPLIPPHCKLRDQLAPWKGREIWLEIGPGAEQALVSTLGTDFQVIQPPFPTLPYRDPSLLCHYGFEAEEDRIRFTLVRTREDLRDLEQQAEAFGVTRTVGLFQELV